MAWMAVPEDVIADELAQVRRERDLYVRLLRLGDERGIDLLLREALSLAVDATGARQGYVEVRDPADEPGCRSVACGLSATEVARVRVALAQGPLARGMATGRTVVAPDDGEAGPAPRRLGAMLCTPIGSDPPLGVLYLQAPPRRGDFTTADRETAELVARHLAPLAERLLAAEGRRDPPVVAPAVAAGLIGRSAAFATMRRRLALVAPLDVPVCVMGEPGAGTTSVARALHDASPRAHARLVRVDCRALAPGATSTVLRGADAGGAGALHDAAGGTLLLDDVDALGVADQALLADVLATHRYRRPDAPGVPRAVRVVATMGDDPDAAVAAGRLHRALHRQLGIMALRVPSLAERRDDVTLLATHFLAETCREQRLAPVRLSPGALEAAQASAWPENVRQLRDAVAAAARRAAESGVRQVERRHLFAPVEPSGAPATLQEATRRFQAGLLADVLAHLRWDVERAAARLDLRIAQVDALIRTFRLDRATR